VIREYGRRVVAEDRAAIRILEDHDRRKSRARYVPELIYLELEDVLGLYADVFGLNDQEARDRLRNEPGLQAALIIAGGYNLFWSFLRTPLIARVSRPSPWLRSHRTFD